MKVEIRKEDNGYCLSIKSGHFSGILEGIDRDSIETLYRELGEVIEEKRKNMTWNPRSRRWEVE